MSSEKVVVIRPSSCSKLGSFMDLNIKIAPCRYLFSVEVKKSVTRPWKALIEINTYRKRNTNQPKKFEKKYFSSS